MELMKLQCLMAMLCCICMKYVFHLKKPFAFHFAQTQFSILLFSLSDKFTQSYIYPINLSDYQSKIFTMLYNFIFQVFNEAKIAKTNQCVRPKKTLYLQYNNIINVSMYGNLESSWTLGVPPKTPLFAILVSSNSSIEFFCSTI